jgi:hypothetical protein
VKLKNNNIIMKNILKRIKEIIIDDEDNEVGVYAVSVVDDPATFVPFEYFAKQINGETTQRITFKIEDTEKKTIRGLILQSGQMIYRNDIGGQPGYVWFSRETVRKLKEKYGMNRSLTFQHRDDVTGNAILMKSWLEEEDDDDIKITKWFMEFKLLPTATGEKLWNVIKAFDGECGFSIEAIFNFKRAKEYKIIEKINDIKESDLQNEYRWVLGDADGACETCKEWSKKTMKLEKWIETALPRVKTGTMVLDLMAGGEHEPYNTFCEENCRCYLETI